MLCSLPLFEVQAQASAAFVWQRPRLKYKQQNGERTGGIKYGYTVAEDGKTLIENPEEQQVIHAARDMYCQSMSLQGIARELTKRGFRSRTGREFCATQVKRMLAE